MSQKHLISLAVADGRALWEIPFETSYDQNSVTPIVVGDLLIYGGMSKPTTAIRVSNAGGKWQTATAWQLPDLPMYMSSPVESGGFLFGLTHRNRGQFFCVDARSGKVMWTTKGREAENAALLAAGNIVLAATTEGELVVMRNTPRPVRAGEALHRRGVTGLGPPRPGRQRPRGQGRGFADFLAISEAFPARKRPAAACRKSRYAAATCEKFWRPNA